MLVTRRTTPAVLVLCTLLFLLWRYSAPNELGSSGGPPSTVAGKSDRSPFYPGVAKPQGANYSRVVIVPKTEKENVDWISEELPGLETAIYEVDNPSVGQYRVPKNKGHEAMAYLTYIIDHFDDLPDTLIFIHSHKESWHNNMLLDLDMAKTIRRLSDDRVARQGYMNLRCHLFHGCPKWVYLDKAEVDYDYNNKPEEPYFSSELFQELFPGNRPPQVLSQPCCGQFAVSRQRVLDNPKKTYEHLRSWLLNTEFDDTISGRIFEYTWQYLFTRNAEYCPPMNYCYCDGYGICFGSAKLMDHWFDKLKQRETAEQELDAAVKAAEDKDKIAELNHQIFRLNRELAAEKNEAFRRGEDEKNRAVERERTPSGS